jgi:antitoxin component of MazEF toxin-antitoxin module
MYCNDNIDNSNQNKIEYRKVQAIHGNSTFVLVLPKDFVSVLNIAKGDYVRCSISDNKMMVEKIAN